MERAARQYAEEQLQAVQGELKAAHNAQVRLARAGGVVGALRRGPLLPFAPSCGSSSDPIVQSTQSTLPPRTPTPTNLTPTQAAQAAQMVAMRGEFEGLRAQAASRHAADMEAAAALHARMAQVCLVEQQLCLRCL
jgi:hypothetical protein